MTEERVERWARVPGLEAYECSDLGRVRSYYEIGKGKGISDTPQRILSPAMGPGGYLFVVLSKKGKQHARRVHQLVLGCFVGPRPEGMVVCHNNDVKTDNRLENLRYDTRRANNKDIDPKRRQAWSPFTEEQVIAMREEYANDPLMSTTDLGEKYGANPASIWYIVTGKYWTNVGGPITTGKRTVQNRILAREAEEMAHG